jgi:hypothetical protein
MRGQSVPNHRRRKDKESESIIESAAHKPLKNKKQKTKNLHDKNQYILININTEY